MEAKPTAGVLYWCGGLITCGRRPGIFLDLQPRYLLLRLTHGLLQQVPLRLCHRRPTLHLREVCLGRLKLGLQLHPLLLLLVF